MEKHGNGYHDLPWGNMVALTGFYMLNHGSIDRIYHGKTRQIPCHILTGNSCQLPEFSCQKLAAGFPNTGRIFANFWEHALTPPSPSTMRTPDIIGILTSFYICHDPSISSMHSIEEVKSGTKRTTEISILHKQR